MNVQSVQEFYIKLYLKQCEKDGAEVKYNNKYKTRAVQSWNTLSSQEREIIKQKYIVFLRKHNKKIGNKLESITFNEYKCISGKQTNDHEVTTDFRNDDLENDTIAEAPYEQNNLAFQENDVVSFSDNNNQLQNAETPSSTSQPTPPAALNARELYNKLNSLNSENSDWDSLQPDHQKCYEMAMKRLKTDYIKRYEHYLNSLTDKELYDFALNNL